MTGMDHITASEQIAAADLPEDMEADLLNFVVDLPAEVLAKYSAKLQPKSFADAMMKRKFDQIQGPVEVHKRIISQFFIGQDDTFTLVLASDTSSSDQSVVRITISGCLYGLLAGTAEGSIGRLQAVLVKLGPAPADQSLALSQGRPWEPLHQVEREKVVRAALKGSVRNLAPLVAAGTVSNVSARGTHHENLIGRACLAMASTGSPLVTPGATRLPVLQVDELACMLRCLLAAVLDLNAQEYWHCDINPCNIGVILSAPYIERYYLYDLGAAAGAAVAAWAREKRLDWNSSELACYGSIVDPQYSSFEALQGQPLTSTSDIQSLVYTAIALSGHELPWSQAAAARDMEEVMRIRVAVSEEPTRLSGVSCWPSKLQAVAYAAVGLDCTAVELASAALSEIEIQTDGQRCHDPRGQGSM